MSVIMSIFLGLVQGITEFLPISSSGHLSVLQNLLGLAYEKENHLFFEALLRMAALVSICVVYRFELKTMISDTLDFLRHRADTRPGEPVVLRPSVRTVLFVAVGTVPMILALIFSGSVSRLFGNTAFIGFSLLMTGAILYVSDRYVKKGVKSEKTMTMKDAVIIGLAQAAAIVPGLSRSGVTIAVGLSRGLNRNFSVRFSLLLSIPVVVVSMLWTLVSMIRTGVDTSLIPAYLAGFVVAAVVGFFSIQFLRRVTARGSFGKFSYYCWAAGLLTIILSIAL